MKTLIKRSIAMLVLVLGVLISSYGQTTNSQSFDGTFPPSGWTSTPASSGLTWSGVTTGGSPACAPHSGAGMAKCNSFSVSSGTALLITPVIDYTMRGANTPTVSFWMYRDGGYSTTADNVTVYVNTTNTTTGATNLGVVNRSRNLAPIVATNGWYQYSFDIPAAFAGSTNYLLFAGNSFYGNNMYLDDIVYISYPIPPPGTFTGLVTNGITGVPIPGVNVTAGGLTATTGDDGTYNLLLPGLTYDVVFTKVGFQSVTVLAQTIISGGFTTVDAQMYENAIAPAVITALVNPLDTQCDVTWTAPFGP
ncbi:MAG: choice-of-anchor J domain-containing protein, partial [Bacteroidales bacterium]